jgi:hypothetical protein
MSNEVLGLVGLLVLLAAIFIGFPIAFTLGALALGIGFVALGPVVFDLAVLQTFSVMRDTVLAAIPFFLFMGFLLEQSGLMERLFTGIQQLLAGLRGSLYLAVDDAQQLRRADERRCDHRRRHAGHPDPAIGDVDRHGPGGGRARHRPVCRGGAAGTDAVDHLHRLVPGALLDEARTGSGAAAGAAAEVARSGAA